MTGWPDALGDVFRSRRGRWWVGGVVTVAAVCVAALWRDDGSSDARGPIERRTYVKIKRAVSGHAVKLKHSDERVYYAGIRAPYPDEPLYAEAKARNAALVDGRKLRVRYDDEQRDKKGRLQVYVFDRGTFVNETLVREGLAYVRVTPNGDRFAERLLAAQAEARRKRRGIWALKPGPPEQEYAADAKYGNFHRPSCEEVPKIKPERLRLFKRRHAALGKGFAPCARCKP
ncbi:MAG: thermonuclease family protein [Phycisphaerae bacterium]